MAAANVPDTMKNILFPYAVRHAWKLKGLEVIDIDGVSKSRVEHLTNEQLKFVKYMHIWDEAGTTKKNPKNSAKSRERVITCIFVGYDTDSNEDCMIKLNLTSNFNSCHSRDVTFLQQMYY